MSDYDSLWREALDLYFEPFLAFFFPRPMPTSIGRVAHETLETELQQVIREAALGRQRADKLVKVWLRAGRKPGS